MSSIVKIAKIAPSASIVCQFLVFFSLYNRNPNIDKLSWVIIHKVKSSARKALKQDVNPLYGVESEEEVKNTNHRSDSLGDNYDYMGD